MIGVATFFLSFSRLSTYGVFEFLSLLTLGEKVFIELPWGDYTCSTLGDYTCNVAKFL
jgi:hypothetical protein